MIDLFRRYFNEDGGDGGGGEAAQADAGEGGEGGGADTTDWRGVKLGLDAPENFRGKTVNDILKSYSEIQATLTRTSQAKKQAEGTVADLTSKLEKLHGKPSGKKDQSPIDLSQIGKGVQATLDEFGKNGQFSEESRRFLEVMGIQPHTVARLGTLLKNDQATYKTRAAESIKKAGVEATIDDLVEHAFNSGQYSSDQIAEFNRLVDEGRIGFWLDIANDFTAAGKKSQGAEPKVNDALKGEVTTGTDDLFKSWDEVDKAMLEADGDPEKEAAIEQKIGKSLNRTLKPKASARLGV